MSVAIANKNEPRMHGKAKHDSRPLDGSKLGYYFLFVCEPKYTCFPRCIDVPMYFSFQ